MKQRDEDETQMEYKKFRTTGIKLKELRERADWPLVLRMLRVLNDISLAPSISFLLRFCPDEAGLRPILGAVNWHLLKWRLSMAAESVKEVIEPLRLLESGSSNEVWAVIRKEHHLMHLWTQLQPYFKDGSLVEDRRRAQEIRDKQLVHYDSAPVNRAFDSLLSLYAKSNSQAIGWHIQSDGDEGQITRNVLLDELLNIAFCETYKVEINSDGPVDEQMRKTGDSMKQFLGIVANFINGVVIAYCESFELITIESKPPWLIDDPGCTSL